MHNYINKPLSITHIQTIYVKDCLVINNTHNENLDKRLLVINNTSTMIILVNDYLIINIYNDNLTK